GIRDWSVTGVQTCALPISMEVGLSRRGGGSLIAPVGWLVIGDSSCIRINPEDQGLLPRWQNHRKSGWALFSVLRFPTSRPDGTCDLPEGVRCSQLFLEVVTKTEAMRCFTDSLLH